MNEKNAFEQTKVVPIRRKEVMYLRKPKSKSKTALFSIATLFVLGAMLLPLKTNAQSICSTALSDGPTWLESKVHVGDTVHFLITLTAPNGVCRLQAGTNWVVT